MRSTMVRISTSRKEATPPHSLPSSRTRSGRLAGGAPRLALKDSEKRLADIIDFLPDATFAIDRAGRVIAWNRAIEEMTGVAAAGMMGKGDNAYAVLFYGSRRKMLIDLVLGPDEVIGEHYENILREKGILTAYTDQSHPKGRAMTIMGKASPLYNRQGEIVGAIETIRDITDLTNAEKELRDQYSTLAANEQQNPGERASGSRTCSGSTGWRNGRRENSSRTRWKAQER